MQCQNSLCVIALSHLNNLLRLLISEAALATDDRARNTCRAYVRLFVQREDTAVGILILVRTERTEEVAQSLGEHRDGAIHQINTRGTLIGFVINDTTRLHVVAHVSDMYSDFVASFSEGTEGERVIEVLRITWVNGAGQYATEVLTLCQFGLSNLT